MRCEQDTEPVTSVGHLISFEVSTLFTRSLARNKGSVVREERPYARSDVMKRRAPLLHTAA